MNDLEYSENVFLNYPFDAKYKPIERAIVFAVYDCGFVPRCSLEEIDSSNTRYDQIVKIIAECKFGIHDISRTGLDSRNRLPRFNMPLELGIFLGAKEFGQEEQVRKNCLILDRDEYRYQKFISDISGKDVYSHGNKPNMAISKVRSWLNAASGRKTIPGEAEITRRHKKFLADLSIICRKSKVKRSEMTYNDYSVFASNWCRENPLVAARGEGRG